VKPSLLAYTQDGRLKIDNNLAENALRGIAVGRKNWLFAGADCGGERAAAMYSLLETAKLNSVNPQIWLTDVLDRIGKGHPINRIDELLPWAWDAARSSGKDVACRPLRQWQLSAILHQKLPFWKRPHVGRLVATCDIFRAATSS
jgi:hypothetical protein